jgi:hypothetical protein
MCTMIVEQAKIAGCGKGAQGWFVNEAEGPGARVAVEMSAESARQLVQAILTALERAEAGGHIEETAAAHAGHHHH